MAIVDTLVDMILDQRPRLGIITLDASVRELHENEAELTENPVESGADMSDHYRDLPKRVQLEAVVSRSINPLKIRSPADLSPTRHIDAWRALVELKESHERFILVTSLETYTNMMFESGPTAVRDLTNTHALRFTAVLRQVHVAYMTRAEAIAAEIADEASVAAAKATQGTTAATATDAADAIGGI